MKKRDIEIVDHMSPERYHFVHTHTYNSLIFMVIKCFCDNCNKTPSGKIM